MFFLFWSSVVLMAFAPFLTSEMRSNCGKFCDILSSGSVIPRHKRCSRAHAGIVPADLRIRQVLIAVADAHRLARLAEDVDAGPKSAGSYRPDFRLGLPIRTLTPTIGP
jgi:hypothetical protein